MLCRKKIFFKDKIDPNLINNILIDISSHGKCSAKLDESTYIDLLDRLHSIKQEIVYVYSQPRIKEETEFLKKTKIQFELTSNDRLKVINGTSYKQTILLDDDAHEMARLINNSGRELLQNAQYQEAISKFKQAYKMELKDSRSLTTCSSTLKLYQNNTALAQRQLATSIGKEASDAYGSKDYQKALEKYQNATEVLNDIECQTPLDKETCAIYQLNISRCHHEIGRALQNKKLLKDALEQYIQAENIYKQLPAQQQKADELKKQELAVEATRNLIESTQENGETPSSPVKMSM